MPDTELAEELLQIEEADAWFEYLEATRAQSETRYAEVEPWAWARLNQRLRAVRARRAGSARRPPEQATAPVRRPRAMPARALIPCIHEAQLNMATVFDIRCARPASRWDAVRPRALQRGEALFALVPMEEQEERAGRARGRNDRSSRRPG